MQPTTHSVTLTGHLLRKGFWLYVWEIKTTDGRVLHYVGRTGDSSSMNAQSPYNRLGQHLGFGKTTSQVRRYLMAKEINPEDCLFKVIAHGPILPEVFAKESYTESRDTVAALEKALADAMTDCGYDVMNTVNCRKPVNIGLFNEVRAAFAEHFPALQHTDELTERPATARRLASSGQT